MQLIIFKLFFQTTCFEAQSHGKDRICFHKYVKGLDFMFEFRVRFEIA